MLRVYTIILEINTTIQGVFTSQTFFKIFIFMFVVMFYY